MLIFILLLLFFYKIYMYNEYFINKFLNLKLNKKTICHYIYF